MNWKEVDLSMRIFLYALREFDELPQARLLSEKMGVEFGYSTEHPTLETAGLAQGYDAISCTPCPMNDELLEKFRAMGVKYLTTRSIGYDFVPLAKAKQLGMRVSNVSYPPNGVANYAIMMILMCLRRMPYIMKSAAMQDFSLNNKIGKDISGCTVGVIGTGRIGATVIRHLSGFGCKMLAYDLYPNEGVKQYAEYVPLEELYARSDVITLHAPATAENYHMIDAASIAKMQDGVCIVNTARGQLIDTDALIAGLYSGKVGSAALDVMEKENGLYYFDRRYDLIDNAQMNVLRTFPNVIVSPHTAFYTEEVVGCMLSCNFRSVYNYVNGLDDPQEIKL